MALQLSSRAAPCLKAARIGSGSRVARQAVVVRAKELREFREDTGEVVNAGDKAKASQQGNGGLYADQVPAAVSCGRVEVKDDRASMMAAGQWGHEGG